MPQSGGASLVFEAAVVLAGVSVLAAALSSLRWARFHDAPIMEYAAWLIRRGDRPYVDFFDMNFPGTYLFHVLGQSIFGTGDISFRVRDLLVLVGGGYAMYRLLRPFTKLAAAVGVVLLATRYLVYGGAEQSLQRDWLVALLMIGAVALLMDGRGRRWQPMIAGGLLGYACTIKPQAVLVLGLAPVFLWLRARTESTQTTVVMALRAFVPVLTAAVVVVGLVLGWVVASGSWSGFTWMATKYLPLYSRLDSAGTPLGSTQDALSHSFTLARGRLEVPLLGFGVLVLLLRRRPPAQAARLVALALLLLAGFVYGVLGIKNWDYHFWPFTVAGLAVVAVAFSDLRAKRWAAWDTNAARWGSQACSAVFLFFFSREVGRTISAVRTQLSGLQHVHVADPLPRPWLVAMFLPLAMVAVADLLHAWWARAGDDGMPFVSLRKAWSSIAYGAMIVPLLAGTVFATTVALDPEHATPGMIFAPYPAWAVEHDKSVAALLRERARPGDRVQVLDTSGGGVDIALRAGLEPGSRFIYDFHFFHDVDTAVNATLRREMMQDLTRKQPRFILFYQGSWFVRTSYAAIGQFPELEQFLRGYRVISEDFFMRVLERV
jgi:hypothetical protein